MTEKQKETLEKMAAEKRAKYERINYLPTNEWDAHYYDPAYTGSNDKTLSTVLDDIELWFETVKSVLSVLGYYMDWEGKIYESNVRQ